MVLTFNYLSKHDAVNIAVHQGDLSNPDVLGDCIERIDAIRSRGNLIGFFLDVQVPDGSSKADIISRLQRELGVFSGFLSDPVVANAHSEAGLYTAQDLSIRMNFKAYFGQPVDFYINCYNRIIETLRNTNFQTIQ